MAQFSLKDWTVNIIPGIAVGNDIVPAGAPVAVSSFTSIDFDPGGQADYVAGPNVHPLAIAIMMAKGKCDIEISQASDGWDVRSALGGVGGGACGFDQRGVLGGSFHAAQLPPDTYRSAADLLKLADPPR